MIGFLGFSHGHGLAKGDRGRFQKSAASITGRSLLGSPELFLDLITIVSLPATQASDIRCIPMKLDDLPFGVSSLQMEAIDVLRNDAIELAQPFHLGNGQMGWIGLGFSDGVIHLGRHLPVFDSGGLTRDEILIVEVFWVITIPNTPWTAEVRNP
jgi:hypothetical protein